MKPEDVIGTFSATGALQEGHFQLVSGLHSSRFFQAILVFAIPAQAEPIVQELSSRFADIEVDAVLGMNPAGTLLANGVARALGARMLVARQNPPDIALLRGFTIGLRDRILIVDDVTTTGGSVSAMIELVRQQGGKPVGAGLLATKGLVALELGVPTEILVELQDMDAVSPGECALCKKGIPLAQ